MIRIVCVAAIAVTVLPIFPIRALPKSTESPFSDSGGPLALLLAEGRLVVVDPSSGQRLGDFALAAKGEAVLPVGRLALGQAGRSILAVLPDGTGMTLVAFDLAQMQGRLVGQLPPDTYPAVSVGRRTGRIFAFGSRNASVLVVDPWDASIRTHFSDPEGRGSVYSGAVSADERRMYISYHGDDSGVDIFDVNDDRWRKIGHIESHGNVVLSGDDVLASDGGHHIIHADASGKVMSRLDNGLAGNHFMELAVSEDTHVVASVGSCLYAGGVSTINLTDATLRILAPAVRPRQIVAEGRRGRVCGERIAASPDGSSFAISALTVNVTPSVARSGVVLVVDAKTGNVRREIETTSEVVDLLWSGQLTSVGYRTPVLAIGLEDERRVPCRQEGRPLHGQPQMLEDPPDDSVTHGAEDP